MDEERKRFAEKIKNPNKASPGAEQLKMEEIELGMNHDTDAIEEEN